MEVRQNRDDQIREMEETLSKETERSTDLKSKLCDSRNTTTNLESTLTEAQAEINCLKTELNVTRTNKEKLACELADISGRAVASVKSLTSKNESLQIMVSTLCSSREWHLL